VVTTPYHSEPTFFVKFQCLIKKFVHCFRLTQWHSFIVLFIASVSARPGVGNAVCTDILIAEPSEQPPTREYLALLQAQGYRTAEDVQTERRLAREQAERVRENALLDALKREQDLKQMHEIGTRVCRDDKGVRYTGFIEQTTERKVKISITFADMIGHPNLHPGGFQPTTIWDNPENWFVCE
jgi:ribosomal protein L20